MSQTKRRLLIVASHPVQYAAPLFRLMTRHPKLEILVAYCSLQGAEPGIDPEFGIEITWDIPLLKGYPWVKLSNQSFKPKLGSFWGLINLELWNLIQTGNFDAIILYTGYAYASFWIAVAAAKSSRTALLFGTDAHQLSSRDHQSWKASLKKLLWPFIFRLANIAILPSSGSINLLHSLGIPEQRLQLVPYVVNNEWWIHKAQQVNRSQIRQHWQIPEDAPIVLFCGKFQPWKRPLDVLQAFAQANLLDCYLVMAGEGPLRVELEAQAQNLGIAERVKFLGFVNQSQLPSVYRSADLLIFPSEYEPFGVVVNEAMLCGCPVIVSDRIGARYDLIREGETGLVYSCGDINALAAILRDILPQRERLQQMAEAAYKRMETWSPADSVEALVQAIEAAAVFQQGNLVTSMGRKL